MTEMERPSKEKNHPEEAERVADPKKAVSQEHPSEHHGWVVADEKHLRALVAGFQEAGAADKTVLLPQGHTKRNYDSDWRLFVDWCNDPRTNGMGTFAFFPAEPSTVVLYLTWAASQIDSEGVASYSPATIARWLASINKQHAIKDLPTPGAHPTIEWVMAEIRRSRARPAAKKTPLQLKELGQVLNAVEVNSWPQGVRGARDIALMLVGFVGAFYRSELAAIRPRDVRLSEEGLRIEGRGKTPEREREDAVRLLPFAAQPITCPPCAYFRWLRAVAAQDVSQSAVEDFVQGVDRGVHICVDGGPKLRMEVRNGPLFRPVSKSGTILNRQLSDESIRAILEGRFEAAGFSSANYGFHSLRAGFVMQAFRDGADHIEVMQQTGLSMQTVEEYAHNASLPDWDPERPLLGNAVTRIDL